MSGVSVGLDTIALAVAHLEQQQTASTTSTSAGPPTTSTVDIDPKTATAPSFPGRDAFGNKSQNPRLVTDDGAESAIKNRAPAATLKIKKESSSGSIVKTKKSGSGKKLPFAKKHPTTLNDAVRRGTSTAKSVSEPPSPFTQASAMGGSRSLSVLGGAEMHNLDINQLKKMIFDLDLDELKTIPVPPPALVIKSVGDNDVLCGRGGESNHHFGNITFRACVKACQPAYIEAKRRDKPFIAQRIVLVVRRLGGRFLKKDRDTNTWRDVGNVKAREKTSQALREGAPELRQNEDKVTMYAGDLQRRVSSDTTETQVSEDLAATKPSPRPTKKQRRVSLFDLADAAANSPKSASSSSSSSSPILRGQHDGPHAMFAATVSADDEEGSHQSCNAPTATNAAPSPPPTPSRTFKGPRIKLLKRRLQEGGY